MATKAKAKPKAKSKSKAVKPAKTASGLNFKQELFVTAYVGQAKGNATEAARIAGYAHPGQQGERLLKNVEITGRVKNRIESAAMSADEVLKELTDVARADWREFVSIKYNREGEMIDATLLLKDKLKALELLGKHHKLFIEKHEVTGNEGAPLFEPFAEAMSKIYGNSEKRTNKAG